MLVVFFTLVFVVLMGLLTVMLVFQDTRANQIYLELKIKNIVCLGGLYNHTYFHVFVFSNGSSSHHEKEVLVKRS